MLCQYQPYSSVILNCHKFTALTLDAWNVLSLSFTGGFVLLLFGTEIYVKLLYEYSPKTAFTTTGSGMIIDVTSKP